MKVKQLLMSWWDYSPYDTLDERVTATLGFAIYRDNPEWFDESLVDDPVAMLQEAGARAGDASDFVSQSVISAASYLIQSQPDWFLKSMKKQEVKHSSVSETVRAIWDSLGYNK